MITTYSIQTLCESLKERIFSPGFQQRHCLTKNGFTRNRLLPFPKLISYILTLPKKSTVSALDNFFESLNLSLVPSKQAFSKARQFVDFQAFKELFFLTTDILDFTDSPALWKNYHLFAVDGMNLSLPSTKETRAEFGILRRYSQERVSPKVSVLYDITNDLIVDVHFGTVKTDANERRHAITFLSTKVLKRRDTKQCILLFDRGYPGRELIDHLEDKQLKFLMRCSTSFLNEVNEASMGDHIVIDDYKGRQTKLRVLKFKLPSGEIEMLVTNVLTQDLTLSDMKELYFMRWGIITIS